MFLRQGHHWLNTYAPLTVHYPDSFAATKLRITEHVTRFTPGTEGQLKRASRGSKVTEDSHCGLNDLALRKCRNLLMAVIVPHSWN